MPGSTDPPAGVIGVNGLIPRRLMALAVAAAIAAAGGCQPGAAGPRTVPVAGVVTFRGEPAAGATVSFQPTSPGRSAAGITDASGRYQLTTTARNDGAVPGDYKVVIVKFPQTNTGTGPDEEYRPAAPSQPRNELPEKYAAAETSGLAVTVSAGSPNVCDFQLQ